jgi:hypothetical protein
MYNDRDFQGHFSTGSRAQTAVLPDDAWFPATLPLPFRERFLADTKSDNVVSFINQYSVDAERAAQTAVYQSSTLPAASPSLGANLATELVDAMRSGNWSCSSYFRITVPPTLKPFSAWSFLTTLADISLPLLPPRGLSHTEVVACLSNLWWVLSTPLQCGSTAQMFRELPAVVDNTPLLRGLGLLINLLSRSTRGPFGSLADYWSDCSAEEKNSLAYRALTDADKLLDIFCVFIRPHSGTYPSIRRAVATDRPPTEWTLVNPALSDSPTVNWLSHHDQDNITTLPQFTAAWETNVVAFWRDVHCRDRTVSLGRAPAAFVSTQPSSAYDERQHRSYEDSSPLTKREGKKGSEGGRGDKVERAKRPIIRWKDSVPSNARTPKTLFETISKGISIQPIFPAADLVRDSSKKKICFGFCLEGPSGGCRRKPQKPCPYMHIDGASDEHKGPASFGSLSKFLAVPAVAEKLEYTARGRELSSE